MSDFLAVAIPLISFGIAAYVAADIIGTRRYDARLAAAGRSRMPSPEPQRGLRKGS